MGAHEQLFWPRLERLRLTLILLLHSCRARGGCDLHGCVSTASALPRRPEELFDIHQHIQAFQDRLLSTCFPLVLDNGLCGLLLSDGYTHRRVVRTAAYITTILYPFYVTMTDK